MGFSNRSDLEGGVMEFPPRVIFGIYVWVEGRDSREVGLPMV